jgi:hypothetical protein
MKFRSKALYYLARPGYLRFMSLIETLSLHNVKGSSLTGGPEGQEVGEFAIWDRAGIK